MTDAVDDSLTPTSDRHDRRRRGRMLLGGAGVLVVGVAVWIGVRSFGFLGDRESFVAGDVVPVAERLTAAPGETLYRIDAARSYVEYRASERLAGVEGEATGRTHAIAGDVAFNPKRPSAVRIGEVVANIRQLRSDNSLRDARIRSAFLESARYPLAKFRMTKVSGLSAAPQELSTLATATSFTMTGELTVRTVTRTVTFAATGAVQNGSLVIDASAKLKLSDFGIEPISIVGLVSVEDALTLGMHLVAVDAVDSVPTQVPAEVAIAPRGGGPSFRSVIQPIIEAKCASCHLSGQIGAHAAPLNTAREAASIADGLALVTTSNYMPPWPASSEGVALRHNRSLTTAEIAALSEWAGAGGPLDVEPTTKIAKRDRSGPEIRRDIVARMPKPYVGSPDRPNDYRCFLVDPKITSDTLVTGFMFEPGETRVTHHALAFHVGPSAVREAAELDGADGQPGWQCAIGTGLGSSTGISMNYDGLSGLLGAWVPGQRPATFASANSSESVGFAFQKGDRIVLQLHYHYDELVLEDRSAVVLQTEPVSDDSTLLEVVNPVAPVEIPCPAGSSGPACDRAFAISELRSIWGGIPAAVPDNTLLMCGKAVEDYADQTGRYATSACDHTVARGGTIYSVFGHMHLLGDSFRMTINPSTDREKVLLDIPHWNFDWQLDYQLEDPVEIRPGDTVRIECRWDRERRPDDPARYMVFSEGTEDEMCFSTYTAAFEANSESVDDG